MTPKDFDLYFHDLANMSRFGNRDWKVESMPYYEEARKAIPDESEWAHEDSDEYYDTKYEDSVISMLSKLKKKELRHLFEESPDPYVAPKKPRPNDPCPCGSGKKYKKCHGRKDL